MKDWIQASSEMEQKQTNIGGTSLSSLVFGGSISAAESQSMLSLFAATTGSIPVSVAFA